MKEPGIINAGFFAGRLQPVVLVKLIGKKVLCAAIYRSQAIKLASCQLSLIQNKKYYLCININ